MMASFLGLVSEYEVDGVNVHTLLEQGHPKFKPDLWITNHAPTLVIGNRSGGGIEINCPNTNHDEGGAFADQKNGDNEATIHCEHNTCKNAGVTMVGRIMMLLRDPKHPDATLKTLMLPEYGLIEYPALPFPFVYRRGQVSKVVPIVINNIDNEEMTENDKRFVFKEDIDSAVFSSVLSRQESAEGDDIEVYVMKDKKGLVVRGFQPVCSYIGFGSMVSPEDESGWYTEIEVEGFTGKRTKLLMSRGDLSDKKVWSTTLREAGLRFYDKDAVVAQLLELAAPKNFKTLVNKMGWQGDVYILPTANGHIAIGAKDDQEYVFNGRMPEGLGIKGTLDQWQENVATLCVGNDKLIHALNMAFAAPIINLTNAENAGFHIHGGSSCGKTTILSVAGSVWGSEKFVQSWKATEVSVEAMCTQYNDCFMLRDESKQMDPKQFQQIPFTIGNGRTKLRGQRTGEAGKKAETFRIIVESSGEHSFPDIMRRNKLEYDAGELIRFSSHPAKNAEYEYGAIQTVHDMQSMEKSL